MRPSDSLFIGDITVIVEGVCEQVFLPKLITDYGDMDCSVFSFINAQGVDNIGYCVRMIKDMNTHVIALFDNDEIGQRRKKDLLSAALLNPEEILTCVSDNNVEIAFEDCFPEEMLFEAVKSRYMVNMAAALDTPGRRVLTSKSGEMDTIGREEWTQEATGLDIDDRII